MFVPETFRYQVLRLAHDVPMGGYLGINKHGQGLQTFLRATDMGVSE